MLGVKMRTKLIKITTVSVVFIYILLIASCSQENHNIDDHNKMNADHNHTKEHVQEDQGMHKQTDDESKMTSIIHQGEIDLVAIDENNDGKIYQDQMCWNVLSDEPGECPKCGMTLKEVTLEEAQNNLEENKYKVSK
jgi:hypothetical protein